MVIVMCKSGFLYLNQGSFFATEAQGAVEVHQSGEREREGEETPNSFHQSSAFCCSRVVSVSVSVSLNLFVFVWVDITHHIIYNTSLRTEYIP